MQGKSAITAVAFAVLTFVSARAEVETAPGGATEIVISIADQKLVLLRDGMRLTQYKVSTSKFGAGDSYGSYKTPLGKMRVCDKVGEALPCGSVIKHRSATGEILPVNAPGRDPIVTRIIWLDGMEEQNKNAKARGIYIHGTVEEAKIGSPVSYGCIRMRSREVMELFEQVPVGTLVSIQPGKLPKYERWTPPPPVVIAAAKPSPVKPSAKPAAEPVAAKPSAPLIASQTPPAETKSKSAVVAANHPPASELRPKPAVVSEPEEDTPRVALSESGRKRTIPADPGAADSLRGSILFADLPGHTPSARPKPTPAPALEPVAEGPRSEPAAPETAVPRVTFRTGHAASVAQRLP